MSGAAPVTIQHAAPRRRWHRVLAERLAGLGHPVRFSAVAPGRHHGDVDRLLDIERRLYGARSRLHARDDGAASAERDAGVTLVLSGQPEGLGRALVLRYDGVAGEDALFDALLAGRAPVVTVGDGARVLAAGHPALQDPHVLARALDDVLPRVVTLLAQAVGRTAVVAVPVGPDRRGPTPGAARLLARGFGERAWRRLRGGNDCRWQLAFRHIEEKDTAAERGWSAPPHRLIPVPSDRLHADPFVFVHDDRTHVFFEDMPFATGKGVISRLEIDGNGQPSAARTVLELPVHLSYPLVLRHRGDIFMLPETSAARRLTLFRAAPFPDRWTEAAVLLDGTRVADATPVLHAGRWWLFAALDDDGGSSWDQLALFHAPDLRGPWTPHRANPVLIDASAARPAGAMWHAADGALMRVAQDCRRGYGDGLAICRVERLDDHGFTQTVVARLAPPPGFRARGVHTLNRAGGVELIDLRQS